MRPHHEITLSSREASICVFINRLGKRSVPRHFFALISRLGDGVFWYALMGLLIAFDGWDGLIASAHLAATGAVALVLYKGTKHWTRRPRPFASDARIKAWVPPLDEFSFLSGHTLHAVAFTLVALAHYPVLLPILLPFTACVAVSRVVLGMHYPSDVLAAIMIGTGLASLALWATPGISLFH